jgi:predicted nucleotidyltransferase
VPEVAAAWIFGSVARGEAREDSDLDVAIALRRDVSNATRGRLLGLVASRLERAARGRIIDLVVLEDQGPIFQHQVLAEGVLVYDADPERRVDVESTAHVRYLDFRPTYDIAAKAATKGFRRWLERQQ